MAGDIKRRTLVFYNPPCQVRSVIWCCHVRVEARGSFTAKVWLFFSVNNSEINVMLHQQMHSKKEHLRSCGFIKHAKKQRRFIFFQRSKKRVHFFFQLDENIVHSCLHSKYGVHQFSNLNCSIQVISKICSHRVVWSIFQISHTVIHMHFSKCVTEASNLEKVKNGGK